MAEEYTLTTPVVVQPEVKSTKYQIVVSTFDWEQQHIVFQVKGDGNRLFVEYGGVMASEADKTEATKFMRTMNTANFTTKSMQKRILEKLSADGKLPPGSVTGTPDPIS